MGINLKSDAHSDTALLSCAKESNTTTWVHTSDIQLKDGRRLCEQEAE